MHQKDLTVLNICASKKCFRLVQNILKKTKRINKSINIDGETVTLLSH